MSTEDLALIHSKTCAILEELYKEKGQPDTLDNAFFKEYFNRISTNVDLGLREPEPRAPHATDAKLSRTDRGVVDVRIASKNEKFLVSSLTVAKTITGTSQRFGSDRGSGSYLMTDVSGIPNITIKTGSAVVAFVGLPTKVVTEAGNGRWVSI